MVIFIFNLVMFEGYKNGAWAGIGGGAVGGGSDTVIFENDRVITTDYTMTKSGHMTGPLTVNTGVTLTIPTGEKLVVL